jgi:hypothetical protein
MNCGLKPVDIHLLRPELLVLAALERVSPLRKRKRGSKEGSPEEAVTQLMSSLLSATSCMWSASVRATSLFCLKS